MKTRAVPIEGALDLRATLRPLHGRFQDDGWWLAARTPSGDASLRIRRTREAVIGETWGDGGAWLLERLGRIAGLEDDPSVFVTSDPLVARLHTLYQGRRFGRTGLVFDALVVAICAQKVTGSEAVAALRGLRRAFGDRAPGPNGRLWLPPDPGRMAVAPYYEFHRLHLEKRRADVIREVSRSAVEIDALADCDPHDAAARLSSVRGIAEWTTATTLAVSHGDADQVPVGDYHVKHIVVHHMTGRDRGTDEEMLELLEPFRPHRGRVVRLLHTLGHEPSFGPRATPRNITRM